MAETKKISIAVIKRLPRYYRYLGELMENGETRISSGELSKRMKVTASQIRQDLNNFGGFGQQGYGYNVAYLYDEIGKILGINEKHRMIIVGAGNIGQALVNYQDFEKRGFQIIGIFDNNKRIIGKKVGNITVSSINKLEKFIQENQIEITALALPREAAKEIADRVVAAGVNAIWNFAPTDLHMPENVVVENVHLSESLMRLSYKLANNG